MPTRSRTPTTALSTRLWHPEGRTFRNGFTLRRAGVAVGLLGTLAGAAFANPVLDGADPDVVVVGNTYWLYPTGGRPGTFHAYSSPDLTKWTDRGVILDFKNVPWINADGRRRHGAWAPGIFAADGKAYLYYAVGPQTDDKPSRIGVAVAKTPAGPFVDSGRALVTGGHGFEAIDPMAFADPATGRSYLYAGGSNGATLRVWELADDKTKLKQEIKVVTPPQFTEGAYMSVRDGVYYLSYSHGAWNDSTYSVHYCTAPSPTGPWTYRGPILTSDATHKGPGHHAFVRNPTTGDWFVVYHRYETKQEHGPYKSGRKIAIDRLDFNADGTIRPVRMTDDGPPASPLGVGRDAPER